MTSSEDVLIREVDEDLNQDRQLAFFRRYGPALAVAAVALLVAVGVFQLLEARKAAAREEAAVAYMAATREGGAPDAMLQFASVAEGGYQQLALLRAASGLARSGDGAAAIRTYARVYEDETTPRALGDLARLRAAYLAVEDVTPETGSAALDAIVSGVTTEAFTPFAREVSALAAMAKGDYASAAAGFAEAANAPGAPQTLTLRATQLAAVARSGAAGVPLEMAAGQDDFIESFRRRLQDGPPVDTAPADAAPQE